MRKNNHKTIIMFAVVLIIVGVCFYFSKNLKSELGFNVAYGVSSLESSSDSSVSGKISGDISFLTTLLGSLDKIKIDTSFFSGKVFSSLKDNSVTIGSVEPGRANPFYQMENNSIEGTASDIKVVTNQPTDITETGATLNGTLNMAYIATNVYFEYGKTVALGTTETSIQPSLVGSFIKNILGLTPKTNYFYRACAKINNAVSCGEVVSFSTK
jgi:hypothetical protein